LLINGAIVVDVRTVEEFNSGHVKGSLNIPMSSLLSNMERLKGKEVILVCRSGMRAQNAKGMLKSNGIQAYNAGAWQNISEL
ncbi:MAG: rhodanese-like domain-containing protein, partial [Bacteroidia bacterium]|nr:rhodanese-like domain-containing protein [Bacteroidia bacterium]